MAEDFLPVGFPVSRETAELTDSIATLVATSQWRGVVQLVERAHAAGISDAYSWHQLGNAFRAIQEPGRAAEAFGRSLALFPAHRETQFLYAVTLKQSGQKEVAVEAYQQLVKNHPGYAAGWSLYGVLLKDMGRYEEAISALRQSLKISADIPTHNILVTTLVRAGRMDEALTEGSALLRVKDAEATKYFQNSAFSSAQLTPVNKAFDYSKRHKNIISFSLWGNDPVYVHGAIINAQIAPHLYHGWRARFYCDETVPEDARRELVRLGADVVMMEDPELQKIRPLWRFLVSDDPEVDWFVCRDADSRLNVQEFLAVEEWVHSGKSFHIMRDHPYHMELILAGMWGGMAGVLPNLRNMVFDSSLYSHNKFGDQQFLMELAWPLLKEDVLIHDSYYQFAGSKDFPPGYRLRRPIHVGGAVKNIGPWSRT